MGSKYWVTGVCGGKADIYIYIYIFFFNQKWLVETAIGNVHVTSDDNVHQNSVWVTSVAVTSVAETILFQLVESPHGTNTASHNCDLLQHRKQPSGEARALIYMTSMKAF